MKVETTMKKELLDIFEKWWKEWLVNNKISKKDEEIADDFKFPMTTCLRDLKINFLGAFVEGSKATFIDLMNEALEDMEKDLLKGETK